MSNVPITAKHNTLVKTWSFQPGDIIICHRQVQSNMSDRISAKLTCGFTAPFDVLGETGYTRYRIQKIRRTLNQETRFGQPREKSAGQLVKIPPFLVIHRPVQGTHMNFASLQAGPQPHALLDTLGSVGYGAMDVVSWLEPHPYKFPSLTLQKHFVALKDNWPGILWDESDDDAPIEASQEARPSRKRPRDGYLDPALLWLKKEQSSYKLLFISQVASNSLLQKCYLVSVLPTTDPKQAKERKLYSVVWWIHQDRDSDKPDKFKKFVPEIHVFHPNSGFGQVLRNFRIGQLKQQLLRDDRERYASDINLWNDGILGPFD
jgi:hypothetical protein